MYEAAMRILLVEDDREAAAYLVKALREAGVESHLEVLPGAKHGGAEFFSGPNIRLMGAFFQKHLGAKTASAE